uniref:Retrotransposon protein n=1 Tax=Cucumis melo TaxID=3656 RepID=A0A9I9DEV6_CUCME
MGSDGKMRQSASLLRRKCSTTGLGTLGRFTEMFADVEFNKLVEYEGFDISDGKEMEFPSMYSQRIEMFEDDVRASRPARASNGRLGSSRSKRKRGSRLEGELDVIHMALECTNDQLRTIVEWHVCALANETFVC